MASHENSSREGVATLIAPVPMHHKPAYTKALDLIRERHPGSRIIADKGLFADVVEWKATWKDALSPTTRLYVVTAEDGTVGRGVFEEWEFLVGERGASATVIIPGPDGEGSFEEYGDFYLEVIDGDDWKRYAAPRIVGGGAS